MLNNFYHHKHCLKIKLQWIKRGFTLKIRKKCQKTTKSEKMSFSYICTARTRIFTDMRFSPGGRYHRTLLSRKNQSKSLEPFLRKLTKTPKNGGFSPLLTPQKFFSKIGLCYASSFILAHVCAKNLRNPSSQS